MPERKPKFSVELIEKTSYVPFSVLFYNKIENTLWILVNFIFSRRLKIHNTSYHRFVEVYIIIKCRFIITLAPLHSGVVFLPRRRQWAAARRGAARRRGALQTATIFMPTFHFIYIWSISLPRWRFYTLHIKWTLLAFSPDLQI